MANKDTGRRPGSGRKPLTEGERTVTVSLRLSYRQRILLTRLGGAAWVRLMLDASQPKDQRTPHASDAAEIRS